jgi:hypothetical protein
MNFLDSILNETHMRAPKGIVYGPPGVGKTTFGAGCNKAIIVDCENGACHVACNRSPYLKTWDEIAVWLDFLANSPHPFESIVIDSIDWLLRRIEEHVAGVNGDAKNMDKTLNRSNGGYGNGKQVLRNYVYQYLLPTLDQIVNRGVSVLLLAHVTRQSLTNIDGITIEKSAPEIHPDLMNTMIEWCDFVGAAKIGASGQRELELKETNQLIAKNRYGIENKIPLSWDAFLNALNNSNEPQSNGEINNG